MNHIRSGGWRGGGWNTIGITIWTMSVWCKVVPGCCCSSGDGVKWYGSRRPFLSCSFFSLKPPPSPLSANTIQSWEEHVFKLNKNTQEFKIERFFISTKQCANFRQNVAFDKATNGQTDVKHENGEHLATAIFCDGAAKILENDAAKTLGSIRFTVKIQGSVELHASCVSATLGKC